MTEPAESLLVAACRGHEVPRTPIWIMRQTGRYMKEYRAVREQTSFLDLCKDPEKAAELSLLPIDVLDVDAAIVFSDILIPIEAMGQALVFGDGGPILPDPIRSRRQLDRLRVADPERDAPWVSETIRLICKQAGDVPVLGFAGAPFTLATYMIEGGNSRSFAATKTLMYTDPALVHDLLGLITDTISRSLVHQIEAGAAAVQVFETWGGILSPRDYDAFAHPYQQRLVDAVRRTGAPVILFINGGAPYLDRMASTGADVLGLDWRIGMREARQRLGPDVNVQGNLDPAVLLGPESLIRERAHEILRQAGPRGHIFNLGHAITPDIPVESVRALVRAVREFRHEA